MSDKDSDGLRVQTVVRQEQEPAAEWVNEVVPGVLRMQLPVTMPGIRHVNCYAIEGKDGVTLIDPGQPGHASWKALTKRLASAGVALPRVKRVIMTHSHADHYGGVARLREESDGKVIGYQGFGRKVIARGIHDCSGHLTGIDGISESHEIDRDYPLWRIPRPWGSAAGPGDLPVRFRILLALQERRINSLLTTPLPDLEAIDGQVLSLGGDEWVSVFTPGHTLDHLCLYRPKDGTLISGDHVLPTITPHVPGIAGGEDSLASFLASLDKVTKVGETGLVLPAHGHPFGDLAGRVGSIRTHHQKRVADIVRILRETGVANVPEIVEALFPASRRGLMAESEVFAHLEHLRIGGKVENEVVKGELAYRLVD